MFQTGDNRAFDALMKKPHSLYVEVVLTDGNGGDPVHLSDRLIDGNVAVDTTAAVTRALDLTLFDPNRRVHLDPGSPQRTSVFIDQRVKIVYTIIDPTNGNRYSCPVFTGGIDDVSRDEVFIKIKALGMEAHAVGNSFRGKTFKKKAKKVWVLRQLITNFVGVEGIRFPGDKTVKALLPSDVKLNREKAAWPLARKVADSVDRYLFMDAVGFAVIRRLSKRPKFVFNENWVTTKPEVDYDLSRVTNAVVVIGKKPKKKGKGGKDDTSKPTRKRRPMYTAIAPKKHPLSPFKLARNGVKRFLWISIEDDSLRSVKECRARARRLLARGLGAYTDIRWEGIPQPRLQEGDMVAISLPGFFATTPLKQWNIPLRAGVDAQYGTIKKVPAIKRKSK